MDPKELETILAGLKAVPESMASVIKRIEELEKKGVAVAPPVAPAPTYRAPVDDRSQTEKAHDGELSFGAYLRGLACKAMGMSFDDTPLFAKAHGEKEYRDACFTVENSPRQKAFGNMSMAEKTALSLTTGNGGYFAPELWLQDKWVDILRPNIVTLAAGISRLQGLGNADVKIPKLSAGATAYWIGEGSSITESELTDTQLALTPHECAAYSIASNQIVRMSNPAIQQMVGYDMAQKIGALIDLAVLEGTGSSNQPTGISVAVTTSTVTTGGAMTWAKGEEFLYKLALQNAPGQKRVWFMHPRTYSAIRQITSSTYALFVGTPQAQAMDQFLAGGGWLGYPVFQSSQMTITGGSGSDAVVLFGVPEEVFLADWGPAEFAASAETSDSFQKNQIHFRTVQLVDVKLRHETSWVKCTDTTS